MDLHRRLCSQRKLMMTTVCVPMANYLKTKSDGHERSRTSTYATAAGGAGVIIYHYGSGRVSESCWNDDDYGKISSCQFFNFSEAYRRQVRETYLV